MIQPFKNNNVKTCFGTAVQKALPIMCSYFFVSMAYGMMMNANGYPWVDSLLVSMTVYSGAFQFVLTTLLSSGFPPDHCSHRIPDEQPADFLQYDDEEKNNRNMPDWLHQLGMILPSAIMAVLIVYCLRGAKSDSAPWEQAINWIRADCV